MARPRADRRGEVAAARRRDRDRRRADRGLPLACAVRLGVEREIRGALRPADEARDHGAPARRSGAQQGDVRGRRRRGDVVGRRHPEEGLDAVVDGLDRDRRVVAFAVEREVAVGNVDADVVPDAVAAVAQGELMSVHPDRRVVVDLALEMQVRRARRKVERLVEKQLRVGRPGRAVLGEAAEAECAGRLRAERSLERRPVGRLVAARLFPAGGRLLPRGVRVDQSLEGGVGAERRLRAGRACRRRRDGDHDQRERSPKAGQSHPSVPHLPAPLAPERILPSSSNSVGLGLQGDRRTSW